MRETASEKSPRNILSDCLVESDPAVRAAGRRTRVASVGVSLLLQAAVLTLLIIVPLFAAGKLPMMQFDAPTPIFRGGDPGTPPVTENNDPAPPENTNTRRLPVTPLAPPSKIPPIIADMDETGHASSGYRDPGDGVPGGIDVPGAVPPGLNSDAFRKPPVDVPPPPAPHGPIKVHKELMEARMIHRVMPPYPPLAKMTGRSGDVELRAIIGTDGRVHSLTVISGHPLLIEAAKQAVMQWRYRPTLLNGEPVEVDTFITVKFVLSR